MKYGNGVMALISFRILMSILCVLTQVIQALLLDLLTAEITLLTTRNTQKTQIFGTSLT